MELREAIEHCDEIIKKMDNCECRKDHEELKEFLKELQDYEDTDLTPEQIAELKDRDTAKAPENVRDAFGDGMLICPHCRNSVINYFNRSRPPRFCMICGQRLQWEGLHD